MPKHPPRRTGLAEHLPPGMEPRGLTKEQAAAYVGCATTRAFEDQVRRGTFPGPMPGTTRYDRKGLDAAMDRLSGIARQLPGEAEADRLLREWELQQAAKQENPPAGPGAGRRGRGG